MKAQTKIKKNREYWNRISKDPDLFCFYTKPWGHPECDWLCMVTDIKQALFYANHFGIPHSGVGTNGECFWIIEPTEANENHH